MIMKKNLVLGIVLLALISCNKDKFQTKPQIEIKSYNTDHIDFNQDLIVRMKITDKEGDVTDSLFVIRQRLNARGPVTLAASKYSIPDYPSKNLTEFQLTLPYATGLTFNLQALRIPGSVPSSNEPDTMSIKFVVRDKEGNKSDTVALDKNIIVIR
jgi:hypothetical protein